MHDILEQLEQKRAAARLGGFAQPAADRHAARMGDEDVGELLVEHLTPLPAEHALGRRELKVAQQHRHVNAHRCCGFDLG